MNDLVTIANRLGLDRLVMIGDRAQLQPIDAGKAFTLVQSNGPAMAHMDTSHRQRTEDMKAVAALTRVGEFAGAFAVLADRVVSAGSDLRDAAAKKWLELSADDRERTALYASGRETRAILNANVQQGLRAEGTLRGGGAAFTRVEAVNLTREELRYARNYHAGQLLEVASRDRPAGLAQGNYDVVRVKATDGSNLVLDYSDRMLARLSLAYAINIHQAQGMTADRGIGVMHSAERHLSNQRLTHVMATRVRDDLMIYTNDRDQLLRSIEANPGSKASALELLHAPGNKQGGLNEKADPFDLDLASMRSDRSPGQISIGAPELKVPEKKLELGL